eukprot:COSAG01_NODE_39064_length_481_cov_1.340314_2_plen_73_part_00
MKAWKPAFIQKLGEQHTLFDAQVFVLTFEEYVMMMYDGWMYVVYVCMYVCMLYVCMMYVCMYVCVCVFEYLT